MVPCLQSLLHEDARASWQRKSKFAAAPYFLKKLQWERTVQIYYKPKICRPAVFRAVKTAIRLAANSDFTEYLLERGRFERTEDVYGSKRSSKLTAAPRG